ncbi:pleckstrin homology domain-containing family M member 1 [Chanos chanos]|uniref:Pleckstrin homology domain-containing family M member 1 n=1 Tax=Chanos chanos TaxID=29144 RepID=A0A6J2VI42_CHACN|nr:pleckstrin homology domain-containing family M member 1 [Chanos chanos]
MLATQSPETGPEAKDFKQWIKENIALTLKALQKRYVTTDQWVTSEDSEANLLCCALEAVFIHGIRGKYIRSDAGGRGWKGGSRGTLPQPVFWCLLKTVTHRDVISELENLSFINTDVGRCRAWVRLALNDGLLECYLTSLLREDVKLSGYYQSNALLLDLEEREVLLSLLQGLASLSFQLSYKSAVLNEWTNTPLALAGLCPATPADSFGLQHQAKHKDSWDSVSQSSGGSDAVQEVTRKVPGRGANGGSEMVTHLASSSLSLDTMGSSQLSSSLSSDSLMPGQELRSPERESWSCDMDIVNNAENKSALAEERELSGQDLVKDDLEIYSPSPDHQSETIIYSDSDKDITTTPPTDMYVQDTNTQLSPSVELSVSHNSTPSAVLEGETISELSLDNETIGETEREANPEPQTGVETTHLKVKHSVRERAVRETIDPPSVQTNSSDSSETLVKAPDRQVTEPACQTAPTPVQPPPIHPVLKRSASTISRRTSADSLSSPGLPNSTSWISEDDFYKPVPDDSSHLEDPYSVSNSCMNGSVSPVAESETPQSPPSVVHRRQIGLSNPFRGLLKLGQLERRGPMGIWRDYYCELSPYELRLYINEEERTCYENCSLLRCEDVHLYAENDGRFRLTFSGKKLYLRAPSRDEAEDWVESITEAVNKCRPTLRDEQYEVLRPSRGGDQDAPSPVSAPSSPEHVPHQLPEPPQLDWTRQVDSELDAIKETVVYRHQGEKGWTSLVLSLSLEALKGFRIQEGRKIPIFTHSIESIRDVVPDASLGGPEFFKVLVGGETLTLRTESGVEARRWREFIRQALNSYLDDGTLEDVPKPEGEQRGNVHRLVQHRLKEDAIMLPHLTTVPTEKGLDAQNFKCAGCPRQIGVSLGRARLCEFTGQNYCESCHHGNAIVIPSRMIHNWDLTAREVSRQALKFLAQIEHEPLLNLDHLNSDLFDHSDTMATVQQLRQRLRLLGDYLLICRSGIKKKILDRLEQRPYLLESSDLYSVLDLRQIADGQFRPYLQSLIQFSTNHVHHCDLCTQRGFICQICNADNIIFPFQFETTTRCNQCKAVFHSSCKSQTPDCPRCMRLQKYLERDLQD